LAARRGGVGGGRRASSLVAALAFAHVATGIVDPNDEEKRMVWKYPDCRHLETSGHRLVDWLAFREELHLRPYPENMAAVGEVLSNLTGNSAEYDEEARVCMMGIPAAFFFLTRYTLDTIDRDEGGRPEPAALRQVSMQYSILENYVSALHPGLIDRANWTFTDAEVMRLRKRILAAHQEVHAWERREEKGAVHGQPSMRIYVYDESEVPGLSKLLQGQIYCSRGQWGTDVQFHDFFVTSPLLTKDPAEADFFFVPGYAICVLEGNIYTLDEVDAIYKDVVRALPYFNASGGRDHIFVFGSGMAHNVFQSWEDYIPQAIVLTPETELFNDFAWIEHPPFHTWRDIVIPGSLDLTEVIGLVSHDKPLSERRYLASFFGRADLVRGPHPWVGRRSSH